MVLDLSQVLTNPGMSVNVDENIALCDVSINGQDIHFTKPVKVSGTVKNISGVLYMELKCNANFETQCSRCLDTVSEELDFEVNERLSKMSSDEEVLLIDSHEFDLDETVVKSFGLELPINYICSDNCKGLCHVCGCNLNHQNCDCEDDNIDPRLAALKDFLK